jgi:hypothetical protein
MVERALERESDAERALGRNVAWGIPTVTVVASVVMYFVAGPGPMILVLAAGALLGVIALFWASLRTLSGDAPLPEGMEAVAARNATGGTLDDRKRRVLRALKDLELEHSMGKIDDADFNQISARYREQAKALMRDADLAIEPMRAKAEELARQHLAKKGLGDKGEASRVEPEEDDSSEKEATAAPKETANARVACPKCATSNETDASFCKKCGASLARAEASDASA